MRALVTGAVLVAAVAGCDGAPDTFTASGVVLAPAAWMSAQVHDSPCVAPAGYGDIREGTQVVATDRSGSTVGLGRLGIGKVYKNPLTPEDTGCGFAFTITGVPAGRGFYQIRVANRGGMSYQESDLVPPADPVLIVATPAPR